MKPIILTIIIFLCGCHPTRHFHSDDDWTFTYLVGFHATYSNGVQVDTSMTYSGSAPNELALIEYIKLNPDGGDVKYRNISIISVYRFPSFDQYLTWSKKH